MTDTASISDTEGLELIRLLLRRAEKMTQVRDKEMRGGDVTARNMESYMNEIQMRCAFDSY